MCQTFLDELDMYADVANPHDTHKRAAWGAVHFLTVVLNDRRPRDCTWSSIFAHIIRIAPRVADLSLVIHDLAPELDSLRSMAPLLCLRGLSLRGNYFFTPMGVANLPAMLALSAPLDHLAMDDQPEHLHALPCLDACDSSFRTLSYTGKGLNIADLMHKKGA